jgi:hypothetical protein
MTVQRIVLAVAGTLILLSVILSITASPHFLWVAAFVGANLLQSAFSRWCLLASLLRKAGVPEEPTLLWGGRGL